jgi:hypothetical protein
MTAITNAQLAAGRFISDTPDGGVLAGQKADGSFQNLLVADETSGDVTLPVYAPGGAHVFGGEVEAAGELRAQGTLNVRDWANLLNKPATFAPVTHTHALSELVQSGASSGQVATWNGSAWVPQSAAVAAFAQVANSAGAVQFGASAADALRLAAGAGISVAFDAATKQVTYSVAAHSHAASEITSGILPAARGGTGVDASGAANGRLLIGNGSGFTLASLTAGANVTITPSAGGITIAAAASGGSAALAGSVSYDPVSDTTTLAGTSFGNVDATNVAMTFTPAGTTVIISVTATVRCVSGGSVMYWNLRDASGDVANSDVLMRIASGSDLGHVRLVYRHKLTGLTAGVAKTVYLGQRGSGVNECYTQYGGQYGPLLMEAWNA